MTVKIYNKFTEETEIKEVIEFSEHSITEQAGRGVMISNFDDNYVITEYQGEQE